MMTIQGVLENLLSHIFHDDIRISASSRTDRYVHAYDQAISFTLKTQLVIQPQTILTILSENLPSDIKVKKVSICSNLQLSLRRDCHSKTYLYQISFRNPNPFMSKYIFFIKRQNLLNIGMLSEVLELFVGQHNFQSYFNYFGKLPPNTKFTCRIINFRYQLNRSTLRFYIRGNRFGRNMVRLIIGDIIDFLLGKQTIYDIKNKILDPSKRYLIFKAPPQGLYLYKTYFQKIK